MAPRLLFVVGERNEGKSTTLRRLIALPPYCQMRRCGILTLAQGEKNQYTLQDLTTRETRLAVSTVASPGWLALGRFFYDPTAFAWANGRILGALAQAELAIFDEIGRLELNGKGLGPSFSAALQTDGLSVVAAVRAPFVDAVKDRYGIAEIAVVHTREFGCE